MPKRKRNLRRIPDRARRFGPNASAISNAHAHSVLTWLIVAVASLIPHFFPKVSRKMSLLITVFCGIGAFLLMGVAFNVHF